MKYIDKKIVQKKVLDWDLGIGLWKIAEMMTFEEAVVEWGDMILEVREVILRLDTETGKTKVMKVLRRAEKNLNGEIIETAY